MPDNDKSGADSVENAEEIKRMEATQHGARGNVHSESEPDAPADQKPPPPLPN